MDQEAREKLLQELQGRNAGSTPVGLGQNAPLPSFSANDTKEKEKFERWKRQTCEDVAMVYIKSLPPKYLTKQATKMKEEEKVDRPVAINLNDISIPQNIVITYRKRADKYLEYQTKILLLELVALPVSEVPDNPTPHQEARLLSFYKTRQQKVIALGALVLELLHGTASWWKTVFPLCGYRRYLDGFGIHHDGSTIVYGGHNFEFGDLINPTADHRFGFDASAELPYAWETDHHYNLLQARFWHKLKDFLWKDPNQMGQKSYIRKVAAALRAKIVDGTKFEAALLTYQILGDYAGLHFDTIKIPTSQSSGVSSKASSQYRPTTSHSGSQSNNVSTTAKSGQVTMRKDESKGKPKDEQKVESQKDSAISIMARGFLQSKKKQQSFADLSPKGVGGDGGAVDAKSGSAQQKQETALKPDASVNVLLAGLKRKQDQKRVEQAVKPPAMDTEAKPVVGAQTSLAPAFRPSQSREQELDQNGPSRPEKKSKEKADGANEVGAQGDTHTEARAGTVPFVPHTYESMPRAEQCINPAKRDGNSHSDTLHSGADSSLQSGQTEMPKGKQSKNGTISASTFLVGDGKVVRRRSAKPESKNVERKPRKESVSKQDKGKEPSKKTAAKLDGTFSGTTGGSSGVPKKVGAAGGSGGGAGTTSKPRVTSVVVVYKKPYRRNYRPFQHWWYGWEAGC